MTRIVRHDAGAAGDEGGFALIVVLLCLVGLTALATAGFLGSGSEHRISQNHRATVAAFYAADAGLQTYLATHRGIPEPTPEVYTLPEGTAEITSIPLNRPSESQTMYLITSRGVHATSEGNRAERSLNVVVLTTPFELEVPGALSSGVGIRKNGDAGELNGFDEATSSQCPVGGQGDKPGVAVPPGGYEQSGGTPVPEGDPPIHEEDAQTLMENTGVPWEGLLDGSVLEPDYTIPPDTWPDFSTLPADEWPVIFVDKDYHELGPDDAGQGTLIVRGDLTMNGSFKWNGLVLVGGAIISDGNQTVKGGTITGLNVLLDDDPGHTDLGNGTKSFRYHSCHVWTALQHLGSLSAQPGSWFERI